MSGMLSLGPGAPRGEYYPFVNLASSILRSSQDFSIEPKLSSLYVGAKESGETQNQTTYGNHTSEDFNQAEHD